jgi:peroxiredoxin
MLKFLIPAFVLFAAHTHAAVKIGDAAPAFNLPSHTGKLVSLDEFADKTVVLEWTNYGCPFVRKHYSVNNMQNLQKAAVAEGVVWLSVVSSGEGKQGYMKPEKAANAVKEQGFNGTAVLMDPEGTVGRTYGATNTPHMFIIDQGKVVYQGAIDNNASWRSNTIKGATNYVTQALAELKAGKEISMPRTSPYGCAVKYKN